MCRTKSDGEMNTSKVRNTLFFFYSSGSTKVCLIKLKLQPRGLFVFVSCTLEKKQKSLNKETNPQRSPVHANSVQKVEKNTSAGTVCLISGTGWWLYTQFLLSKIHLVSFLLEQILNHPVK